MNTNEINEQISKYALFCKQDNQENLIVTFEGQSIIELAVVSDLSLPKLKSLNKIFEERDESLENMRLGIITSSKITGELIRNCGKIDFFNQTNINSPKVIAEIIISEFKEMKTVSDRNNIRDKKYTD